MRTRLWMMVAAAAAPFIVAIAAHGQAPATASATPAALGEKVAFDRGKGNCLACHTMRGSDVPSNVGPELSNIKDRFPDRKDLYAILNNEEARNPLTVMPSFGRDLILSKPEIDQVIAFLYTL